MTVTNANVLSSVSYTVLSSVFYNKVIKDLNLACFGVRQGLLLCSKESKSVHHLPISGNKSLGGYF